MRKMKNNPLFPPVSLFISLFKFIYVLPNDLSVCIYLGFFWGIFLFVVSLHYGSYMHHVCLFLFFLAQLIYFYLFSFSSAANSETPPFF